MPKVRRRYGAKRRATKEYIYREVHKYYKVFVGLVTMRHWRVEQWMGVPVKLLTKLIIFNINYCFNTSHASSTETTPQLCSGTKRGTSLSRCSPAPQRARRRGAGCH